jgi:hypothetical protein
MEGLMKKFLVLYLAPVSAMEQMAKATPEQAKAGMDAWFAWSQKAGSAIVDLGSPLGQPAVLGGSAAARDLGGYSILQAESMAAAKALLDGHPHLMQPGFTIEIHEALQLPGM